MREIIKYCTGNGLTIEKIICERETEHSVWIKNRGRSSKRSTYKNYYDSFAEAKSALFNKYYNELLMTKRRLKLTEEDFKTVQGLEEEC